MIDITEHQENMFLEHITKGIIEVTVWFREKYEEETNSSDWSIIIGTHYEEYQPHEFIDDEGLLTKWAIVNMLNF